MRIRILMALAFAPLFGLNLCAQTSGPWSGILSSSRATDWSTAGVTGGIPTGRTQCGSTINTYTGTANTINTAITNCSNSGGGVVVLAAGTFNLSSTIVLQNNVTLRGQGPSTILNFTSCSGSNFFWAGANVCISMQGPGFDGSGYSSPPGAGGVPPSTVRSWTGTNGQTGVYTQGATVLNLSAAPSGLTVGGTITLWQSDAPPASLPNTGYWVSDKNSSGTGDISWKGSSNTYAAGQTQRARVTAINGAAVTIATPGILRPTGTWATANAPKAGWQSGVLTGAGLEYFRIIRPAVNAVIGVNAAADCWISGLAIGGSTAAVNTILIFDSRNLTIRDNWLDPAAGGGSGNFTSYGFVPVNTSSSLFENNILNQVESPLELNAGSTGNVFGYNYEITASNLEGGFQTHEEGSAMNLFEANSIKKFWSDAIHGSTALNTLFRNHFFSTDVGVDLWTYNRWYSLIGNVIGAPTVYKSSFTDAGAVPLPVSCPVPTGVPGLYSRWDGAGIRLGYSSQYAQVKDCDPSDVGSSSVDPDPLVISSVMLWGNYSAADKLSHFSAAEVPSSSPVFPNPVPASQTLPASFYYTTRPAWWPAQKAWPPIGPDVTGGTYLSGHAYTLPAADCYTVAGGNIANFSAAGCYGAARAQIAPPTNLSATVN